MDAEAMHRPNRLSIVRLTLSDLTILPKPLSGIHYIRMGNNLKVFVGTLFKIYI